MKTIKSIYLLSIGMISSLLSNGQSLGIYPISGLNYTSAGYSCIAKFGNNFLVAGTVDFNSTPDMVILTEILANTTVVTGTPDRMFHVGPSATGTPHVVDMLIDGNNVLLCGYTENTWPTGKNNAFVLCYNYSTLTLVWIHHFQTPDHSIFLDIMKETTGDYLVCGDTRELVYNADAVLWRINATSFSITELHEARIANDGLDDTYNAMSFRNQHLYITGRFQLEDSPVGIDYYAKMRPILRICDADGNNCISFFYFQNTPNVNARLYSSDMITGKFGCYIVGNGDQNYANNIDVTTNNLYENIMVARLATNTGNMGGITWENRYDITAGILDINADGVLHSIASVRDQDNPPHVIGTVVLGSEATSPSEITGSLKRNYLMRLHEDGTVQWSKIYPMMQLPQENGRRNSLLVDENIIYVVGQEDIDHNGNGKIDPVILTVDESNGTINPNPAAEYCSEDISIDVIDANFKEDVDVLSEIFVGNILQPTLTFFNPIVTRMDHPCLLLKESNIANTNMQIDLSIIPNPAVSYFTVKAFTDEVESGEAKIEIFDINGQLIFLNNCQILNGELNTPITLENSISSGIYLLKLTSRYNSLTRKIVFSNN